MISNLPPSYLDRALFVLAFPFEVLSFCMARIRSWRVFTLLLLVFVPVVWIILKSKGYSTGLGTIVMVAAFIIVVVNIAGAKVQAAPFGSPDVLFIWKFMLFLPCVLILSEGCSASLLGAVNPRTADVLIASIWVLSFISAAAGLAMSFRPDTLPASLRRATTPED